MTINLQSILRELYEIDPSLESREDDIIPLIALLLSHDPGRAPDRKFVKELRSKLLTRAREHSFEEHSPSSFSFLTMHKLIYASAGALVAILVTAPAVYIGLTQTMSSTTDAPPLFKYSVTDAGPEAFNFSNITTGTRNQGGGGGMGSDTVAPVPVILNSENGTASTSDLKMYPPGIPPIFTQFEFSYDGMLPELAPEIQVYRRKKGTSPVTLSSLARSFDTGLMDLGSFGAAKVDSITFLEEDQFGYTVNVMLREGSISINQNWEQWPHPENACQTDACWRQYRTQIDDVIPDGEAIRIARAFAGEHGIDLSRYGEPEVGSMWRREYDQAPDKSQIYIPDAVQVVFPLLLDGRPVYDENGMKTGIYMNVHNRHKRVSDVWGIQSQTYQKSNYVGITNEAVIRDYLKTRENISPILYRSSEIGGEPQPTKVQVKLGSPALGFTRFYNFENNTNEELYVPALIFPIENLPQGQHYYMNSISVPLAQKILDTIKERGIAMPLPAVTEPALAPDAASGAIVR